MNSVFFVVEDDNYDVQRLGIVGLGTNHKEIQEKYPFGCVIQIINPYFRIANDKKPVIRVDDPKTVYVIDYKKDICRYCIKENSTIKCPKCRALYCSDKCLKADKNVLNHDDVCSN